MKRYLLYGKKINALSLYLSLSFVLLDARPSATNRSYRSNLTPPQKFTKVPPPLLPPDPALGASHTIESNKMLTMCAVHLQAGMFSKVTNGKWRNKSLKTSGGSRQHVHHKSNNSFKYVASKNSNVSIDPIRSR
jgi:hypothetical protein